MLSGLASRQQPRQHNPRNFPDHKNRRWAVYNQERCSAGQERILPWDQHIWTDILAIRLQAPSRVLPSLHTETALGPCFPLRRNLSEERMQYYLEYRLQSNSRSNDPKDSQRGSHTRSLEFSQICLFQEAKLRSLQEWPAFLLGKDTPRRQTVRPSTNSKTRMQSVRRIGKTAQPAYSQRYPALGSLRAMLAKAQLTLSQNTLPQLFAGLLLHFFRFGNPRHLSHPGWGSLEKLFSCLASKVWL